ncbi:chloride channel core [Streptomyces sp. CB00455]|uniref:chloride channel protein n=1 Tax=Streptomyces sp. CB00455 TaxID=1703927 RepID=UPI000938AF9D|nr:chloride channel protein [Streptomyces sp. CB00455]OKK21888.1 chloride channel core [Streptomyces sp. CB00455]
MTDPSAQGADPRSEEQPREADRLREILRAPGYFTVLAFSALVGIPVSLIAFWFLVALHELERLLWADLPHRLTWDTPPWWWPLPLLLVAGTAVALVAGHLRGAGGPVPGSGGLHTGGTTPAMLPGIVLAAAASLPLGAVLGPEVPLIALGSGLALLFRDLTRAPATPQNTALLGAAGAAAAIAAIFGNPLIAAVLLIEVAGVGGPQLFAVMLPALLSSGVGALVFTGLGRWTGLQTGSLSLEPAMPLPRLDLADVLWTVLIALVLALLLRPVTGAGRRVAAYVSARVVPRTIMCAVGAGACAALYALVTGRTPAEVALSGQAALGELAADPHAWGVGALIAVLLCKSAAYTLCLGSLRGGAIFPALFLGAAAGVLLAPLPGLGVVPAMAASMAAATAAVMRLPVGSVVLVVLLLGSSAMIPIVILAVVIAFVTTELLPAAAAPPTPPRAEQRAGDVGDAGGAGVTGTP